MKQLVIIISILISVQSFGQNLHNDVRFFDDEVHANIQFNSFGYYGSTVLDNYTSQLFYKGGFFNDNLKNESFARLRGLNYFGGEYGFGLAYSNPLSTLFDDAGYYVNFEYKGSAGANFGDDLFTIIFKGNQDFIGDTAHLGPIELANYQYKKIGFGLNQNDRIKMGLGLLSFDAWQKAKIKQGDLAVDQNLDSMVLILDGQFRNAGIGDAPVGLGLAFDFEATFPLGGKNDTIDKTKLIVGIKNFGLFVSNKNMTTYRMDTSYRFSGFNITSISDFQNSIINPQQLSDSLAPKGEVDRIVDLLPFELYFYSPSRPDGKKLQLVYGFRYKYGVGAMPQVYAGADWRPTSKTIISNYLHAGGYALFQWGFAIKKDFGKFKIGISSNNLHGFFTKEAYSQSLGLTMSYAVK